MNRREPWNRTEADTPRFDHPLPIAHRTSLASYFARRGWAHLLLLTGAAIFLFPFFWMLLTSFKTDEEIAEGGFWPAWPAYRQSSPYARGEIEPDKPANVTEEAWEARLPVLRERTVGAVRALASNTKASPLSLEAVSSVLVDRLAPRLPADAWGWSDGELGDAWAALLTDENITAAIEDRTARLELLALQLRTLDASIVNLFDAAAIARDWTIVSGEAALVPAPGGGGATRVSYDFGAAREPIVLRADFDFPCPPEDLHKLILTLRPDDSWHTLNATLRVGERTWVSTRPTPLVQNRAMSVIFQPPGFEDETLQPRSWVPLREEESVSSKSPIRLTPQSSEGKRQTAGPATLTLTIAPSSGARAVWLKATRNYARAFYAVPFWR